MSFESDPNYFPLCVFYDLDFIIVDDPDIEAILVMIRRTLQRLALGGVLRYLLTLDQHTIVSVTAGRVLHRLPNEYLKWWFSRHSLGACDGRDA